MRMKNTNPTLILKDCATNCCPFFNPEFKSASPFLFAFSVVLEAGAAVSCLVFNDGLPFLVGVASGLQSSSTTLSLKDWQSLLDIDAEPMSCVLIWFSSCAVPTAESSNNKSGAKRGGRAQKEKKQTLNRNQTRIRKTPNRMRRFTSTPKWNNPPLSTCCDPCSFRLPVCSKLNNNIVVIESGRNWIYLAQNIVERFRNALSSSWTLYRNKIPPLLSQTENVPKG